MFWRFGLSAVQYPDPDHLRGYPGGWFLVLMWFDPPMSKNTF